MCVFIFFRSNSLNQLFDTRRRKKHHDWQLNYISLLHFPLHSLWLQIMPPVHKSRSQIFSFHFCAMGQSGNASSIFILRQWNEFTKTLHLTVELSPVESRVPGTQVALCFFISRQVLTIYAATFAAVIVPHPPVTRLETTRGKTSIFSILIRISPGKAMIIITSGGRGEMCRSSIPAMVPRKTPEPETYKARWRRVVRYRYINMCFKYDLRFSSLWS